MPREPEINALLREEYYAREEVIEVVRRSRTRICTSCGTRPSVHGGSMCIGCQSNADR